MPQDDQGRLKTVVSLLEGQRQKLDRLFNDYQTGYDAAFDEHGAQASLQRWSDRTIKMIEEHLGKTETRKYRTAIVKAPRLHSAWSWGELCRYLDTYLIRLLDEIEEYPDDPGFNELPDDKKIAVITTADKYDVFLSYSTQDKAEANDIYEALEKAGKKCFLAEKNLQPGDNFQDAIRNALTGSTEAWILVSPNSIQSAWVQREVAAAWALNKRIVPILLRCSHKDLPDILSDAHAIDYHRLSDHISCLR